jgi:hypothetical protein
LRKPIAVDVGEGEFILLPVCTGYIHVTWVFFIHIFIFYRVKVRNHLPDMQDMLGFCVTGESNLK